MTMISHLAMLEEKHGKLEAMVAAEAQRPMPDFNAIQTLKKQKLLLKEEIARLHALQQERIDAA